MVNPQQSYSVCTVDAAEFVMLSLICGVATGTSNETPASISASFIRNTGGKFGRNTENPVSRNALSLARVAAKLQSHCIFSGKTRACGFIERRNFCPTRETLKSYVRGSE